MAKRPTLRSKLKTGRDRLTALSLLGLLAVVSTLTGCVYSEAYGTVIDKKSRTMSEYGEVSYELGSNERQLHQTAESVQTGFLVELPEDIELWMVSPETYELCEEGNHIHRSIGGALTCSEESLR